MNKGNYYKVKTKAWLEEKGYYVDYLEKVTRILKNGRLLTSKRDIVGADGLAMNKTEIIFWNSIYGKQNLARTIKNFLKYPFPSFVKRWVIIWEKRAKEPIIEEVNHGEIIEKEGPKRSNN